MKPAELLGWYAGATAPKEKAAVALLAAVPTGWAAKLKPEPVPGAEAAAELPKPMAPAVLLGLAVAAELPKENPPAELLGPLLNELGCKLLPPKFVT